LVTAGGVQLTRCAECIERTRPAESRPYRCRICDEYGHNARAHAVPPASLHPGSQTTPTPSPAPITTSTTATPIADDHRFRLSMSEKDIEQLDAKVEVLKRRGIVMSRSQLIRIALQRLDLDALTQLDEPEERADPDVLH
jgi:hypothetical protein